MSDSDPTPLACRPDAIAEDERAAHFALLARLFGPGPERSEIAGGYAFHLPAGALAEVARFVDNERRCCPFLSFTIEVAPADGPIRLEIRGPEGTRELLAAELSPAAHGGRA